MLQVCAIKIRKNLCLRAKERGIRTASLKREETCTLLHHKQFSDTSADTYLHAKNMHKKLLEYQSGIYFFSLFCSHLQLSQNSGKTRPFQHPVPTHTHPPPPPPVVLWIVQILFRNYTIPLKNHKGLKYILHTLANIILLCWFQVKHGNSLIQNWVMTAENHERGRMIACLILCQWAAGANTHTQPIQLLFA